MLIKSFFLHFNFKVAGNGVENEVFLLKRGAGKQIVLFKIKILLTF